MRPLWLQKKRLVTPYVDHQPDSTADIADLKAKHSQSMNHSTETNESDEEKVSVEKDEEHRPDRTLCDLY